MKQKYILLKRMSFFVTLFFNTITFGMDQSGINPNINPYVEQFEDENGTYTRYKLLHDKGYFCSKHNCSPLYCPLDPSRPDCYGCDGLQQFKIGPTDYTIGPYKTNESDTYLTLDKYKEMFFSKREKEQGKINRNIVNEKKKDVRRRKKLEENKYNNYSIDFERDFICTTHKCSPLACPFKASSVDDDYCDGLNLFKLDNKDKLIRINAGGCSASLYTYKELFWDRRTELQKEILKRKNEIFETQKEIAKSQRTQDLKSQASIQDKTNKTQSHNQNQPMKVNSLNKLLVGDPVTTNNLLESSGEPKKSLSVNAFLPSGGEPSFLLRFFPWYKKHLENMDKYGLPAVIVFVKDRVCKNTFTPYEPSRLIHYWRSSDNEQKFSKKKFTNPRTEGLGNNTVKSAYFYLIQLWKDESSKCESITSVDKKGSKNDHDSFPFNLDFNFDIDLLNEDEELDEILKNMELSYIGNLNDLIKFHTKKGGKEYKKGKRINRLALALSIEQNFKAMYDLGVLYNRNSKEREAISCYECLESFSPKTIDEEKIQIKPWRERIKYYKKMLKTDKVNEKNKERYLKQAIKLCKFVSASQVATELEREIATEKRNRLNEKRVVQDFLKTIKDETSN